MLILILYTIQDGYYANWDSAYLFDCTRVNCLNFMQLSGLEMKDGKYLLTLLKFKLEIKFQPKFVRENTMLCPFALRFCFKQAKEWENRTT